MNFHSKMTTERENHGNVLQTKEIILFIPNKKQEEIFQLFKESKKVPVKILRRTIGRRIYETFKDQILTVNKYLREKGIIEPFKMYWTTENGREHKVIHKQENVLLETREKGL